ncbi:unnamed protein product [Paramecium primaurelia]|uniref:Uncharacterized protein n=1 Tax=Paramecium primaurelia TaxID=5886 RepID=A0A8S1M6U2_PARPR|nr:unnamed protein product [Paramecium primaurelia]
MKKKSQSKGNTQKLQVEVDIMLLYYNLKKNLLKKKIVIKLRIHKTNVLLKNYGKHVLEKHKEFAKTFQQKNKLNKVSSRPSSRSSSLSKQTKQSETQSQQNQSYFIQSLNLTCKNSANENLKRALQVQQYKSYRLRLDRIFQ